MASGTTDYQKRIVSSAESSEQKKVSVTDSDTVASFSHTMKSIMFYNVGPDEIHFKMDGVPTTNNYLVPSGAWFMVDVPTDDLHFICDIGESATVYCFGVY